MFPSESAKDKERVPDIAEVSLRVHLREVYATIERLDLNQIGDNFPKD